MTKTRASQIVNNYIARMRFRQKYLRTYSDGKGELQMMQVRKAGSGVGNYADVHTYRSPAVRQYQERRVFERISKDKRRLTILASPAKRILAGLVR